MQVPADHEYQEAVQNPLQCFKDLDLSKGRPELLSPVLPIPKPRSGNFATVYRLQNGSKSWAVRCFTRTIHEDQRLRYDAVSRHLASTNLPYFAGFKFLQHGIQIRKTWFPVVKMEWVQGESLKSYIEKNLGKPANLIDLSFRWLNLVKNLKKFKIAHGDLQHENVMVVDKDLRLIDYDGMWVPELAEHLSHEKGHPNYQHPARDESFFEPELDNFSHNVILLSMVSLASDPSLWNQFKGGDECLLFRQRDFLCPSTSQLVQTLQRARLGWVRSHVSVFLDMLSLSPKQCLFFDDMPAEFLSTVRNSEKLVVDSPGGSWIKGYIKSQG